MSSTIDRIRAQVVLHWAMAQTKDEPKLRVAGISKALVCDTSEAMAAAQKAVRDLPKNYTAKTGYELRVLSTGIVARRAVCKSESPDVVEVYEFWKKTMAVNYGLSSARRTKIASRLKEFAVADLRNAIAAARRNTFLMGKNDTSTWHGDLTTIFKSKGAVERLLRSGQKKRYNEPARPRDDYEVGPGGIVKLL